MTPNAAQHLYLLIPELNAKLVVVHSCSMPPCGPAVEANACGHENHSMSSVLPPSFSATYGWTAEHHPCGGAGWVARCRLTSPRRRDWRSATRLRAVVLREPGLFVGALLRPRCGERVRLRSGEPSRRRVGASQSPRRKCVQSSRRCRGRSLIANRRDGLQTNIFTICQERRSRHWLLGGQLHVIPIGKDRDKYD